MFKYLTLNNLLTIIKQLADIGVVWLLFYYLLKIVKTIPERFRFLRES